MHIARTIEPDGALRIRRIGNQESATARDRDRLRQAHLQRLGWRFHRIWSTDWFFNREQEIERAILAYQEAVSSAGFTDADAGRAPTASKTKAAEQAQRQPAARHRGPRPLIPVRDSIDEYSDSELQQLTEWIVSDGLLRTNEEFISEIFKNLPFKRKGSRIMERLGQLAAVARQARKTMRPGDGRG